MTIAVVVAAMLALFAGFVAVQNVASATVTTSPVHSIAVTASINLWATDGWRDSNAPSVGAWPTGGRQTIATEIQLGPITNTLLRVIDGGATYNDNDGQLKAYIQAESAPPGCALDPALFVFTEYDVNDRRNGDSRDAERIVRGTHQCVPGGSWIFYTTDHYANFIEY